MSIRSVFETEDIDSNIQIKGRIQIKLTYQKKTSNLEVNIISCEDLSSVNSKKEACNPYVKVYLLPGNKEKNNKRKTTTKKNTTNPSFDETLRVRNVSNIKYKL